MSQETSIAKNLSVMTISVATTQVIALALKMLMPRVFGPEKMGIFFFAESMAAIFFGFLTLGLSTYISRTIPPRPDHVKDVLWTIIWVQVLMATLLLFALLGSLILQGKDNETIIVCLIMGCWSAIFTFQKDILQRIFVSLNEVVLVSRLNVLVKLILVSGSLFFLYAMPNIAWIALMYLLSEAVGLAILLRRAIKSNFIKLTRSAPYLLPMLKISLPFYLAGVLSQSFGQIDIFMLSRYANEAEVGYYGSAYRIIGICLFLIPILQNSITPALSKALAENEEKFALMLRELLRLLLVICLPLAVGLTVYGDLVSAFLNGPKFEPAYRTVAFITPVLLMMYLNVFIGGALNLATNGRRISIIFVFGAALSLTLDYFAIPYGLERFGPGGAGLMVCFVSFACEVLVLCGMLYMLPQRVFTLRMVFNAFVIFVPCWVGMYFHQEISAFSFWQRIPLFLLFIPYGFATRLILKDDIPRLKEFLPERLRRLIP